MRINEAIQEKIVIYPGRFHPFHKGHAAVFKNLKQQYGKVFISTSDKVDPPKSPFTFAEKKQMMIHAGIPSSAIVQTKNPYQAVEITQNYDPENTIVIFAVSEKDMAEDPRFSFRPKKDGSPSYFQPLGSNTLMPLSKHGYITTVPTLDFNVLGEPMRSATQLRANFSKADSETQKQMITDWYGTYDVNVHNVMARKITENTLGTMPANDELRVSKKGDDYGHEIFGGNKGVAVQAYRRLNNVIDGLTELNSQEPLDRDTKFHILQQIKLIREKLGSIQTEARLYKAYKKQLSEAGEAERPDFNLADLAPELRPLVRQAMMKFPMSKDRLSAVVRMLQQDMERTKGVNQNINRLDKENDIQDVEIDAVDTTADDLEVRVADLEKALAQTK